MFVSASAWKNSVNAAIGSVYMLIESRALKSLNSIEKIQSRMMVATFNGNPSAIIISCSSPINVSNETDLITFYNELSSLVRSIMKHNVLIIGGDMNAQIGKKVNNKFISHYSSNRNMEHQTDFTLENRLTWIKTKFQKRKGKLWTYTDANNAKAQIDYILIRNGIIAHWIAWHIALSRVCPLITEFSRQRHDWAYEGMRSEQPQPDTMIGLYLTWVVLEMNIR